MKDEKKTKKQLISELQELRQRFATLKVSEAEHLGREVLPKQAEHEKQTILDSLVEHVVYHDMEMRVLWANRAACESVGMTREELVGLHCYEIWAKRSDPCEDCPVDWARETGQPQAIEKTTQDGRSWYLQGSPVRDTNGDIVGMVELALEISERKRAEEALRKSEERYRRITEAITDYIFTVQVENGHPRETFHGPACEAVTGYTSEEFDSDPSLWIRMVPEEDRDGVRKQASRILSGEYPQPIEHRIVRKDGHIRWVSNTPVPSYDVQGNLISYDGLVRDITEKKRAKEALQQAHDDLERRVEERTAELLRTNEQLVREIEERKLVEEELRESEERFRNFLENLGDIAYETDSSGNVTYTNKMGEIITSVPLKDMIGKPFLPLIAEESQEIAMDVYRKTLNGENPEYELTFLNGKICQFKNGPLRDKEGNIVGVFGIARDITERKRAEKELGRRDAILGALGAASERFLEATSLEEGVQEMLGQLGQATEVSRVYVFENHLDEDSVLLASQRYEWVAPGISPQIGNPDLQNFPWQAGGMGRWEKAFSLGEIIQGHVKDFPPSEQEILVPQSIQSIMAVPIFVGRDWWGFIGLDDCSAEREWSAAETEALKVAAGTFGALIQHKRAEGALLESEATMKAILAASPVGIGLARNRILDWTNKAMYRIWGYEEGSLLGESTKILYPDAEEYERVGRKFYSDIEKKGIGQVETQWVTKDGREISCFLQGCPLDPSDLSKGVIVAAMDIAERKRTEEALQESERRYRLLAENVTDVIWTMDMNLRMTYESPSVTQLRGYTVEEAMSQTLEEILTSDSLEVARKALAEELTRDDPEQKVPSKPLTLELELKCKDGSTVWTEVKASFLRNPEGKPIGILGVTRDISERKRAEEKLHIYQEQLRSLASELSLTEQRERRRLATDLHDSIGQVLAISKIKLDALRSTVPLSPVAGDLDEVRELIGEAIEQTRSLTFDLSPPVLYELGLSAAVEAFVEKIQKLHGIQVHFTDDSQPKPLSEDTRVLLFRAVQELLINSIKHGRAKNARISTQRDGDRIRIEVKDDGIGFDFSEIDSHAKKTDKFGFFSIRERLHHLGGRFEIFSRPGQGTHATLVASLKRGEVAC
jgi:PAS domain S-box-containing protein